LLFETRFLATGGCAPELDLAERVGGLGPSEEESGSALVLQ
jgi:hypothetical protein